MRGVFGYTARSQARYRKKKAVNSVTSVSVGGVRASMVILQLFLLWSTPQRGGAVEAFKGQQL